MPKSAAVAKVLAALLTLTACSGGLQTPPRAATPTPSAAALANRRYPATIEVGVITSRTGGERAFGEAQLRGYEMALAEINQAGGIWGSQLQLRIEDDASNPGSAMAAMEKLAAQQGLPLVIGAYGSATTLPAAQMATQHRVPFIVPSATADTITQFGSPYVYRINPPLAEYANTLVGFLKDQVQPQAVAIVYENSNFGTASAQPSKQLAEAAGFRVVAFAAYAKGAADATPVIRKVKGANPDVVIFVSDLPDATVLMRQSRELNMNPRAYMGAGAGFSAPEFPLAQGAGRDAEHTFSVTPWTPDVAWQGTGAFVRTFRAKFGVEPTYHSAQAHAALYLVKNVLERSQSLDREAIRKALAETRLGANDTVIGPIWFTSRGQNASPMLVTQVQKGRHVTVAPDSAAVGKLMIPTPPWKQR